MSNKVRIGFVGVGGMGQCAHLRNYAAIPDCEVVAIAEPLEIRARKVAARYGVPHVYKSHLEMLAAEKLDGIVCSQPFTRHGVLMKDLLKAGVPILTEKPLAGSIEVGERILKQLAESGTWHMLGYHKRSDPATIWAKEQIGQLKQSGEIGKLNYIRLLMPSGDWIANGFLEFISDQNNAAHSNLEWDPAPPDMDEATAKAYESFVNYYIHQVNLLRHLLGESYHVTFADKAGKLLVAESAGGITATIEMTPYSTTVDWQESALVAFERGYVKLELPAPLAHTRCGRVEVLRDPGKGATPITTIPTLPWVHAMRQQALNFIRAIRGEIKPPCEAAEALEDLRVAREYIRLWKGK